MPVVIVSCSGGMRMQEGMMSLMQMMKTSAAIAMMEEAKVPFISVLADPTTAGPPPASPCSGTSTSRSPGP